VIFAAINLGLRPQGLTRRREDAKGSWVCLSAKTSLVKCDRAEFEPVEEAGFQFGDDTSPLRLIRFVFRGVDER
jgi:hypothetical protein